MGERNTCFSPKLKGKTIRDYGKKGAKKGTIPRGRKESDKLGFAELPSLSYNREEQTRD